MEMLIPTTATFWVVFDQTSAYYGLVMLTYKINHHKYSKRSNPDVAKNKTKLSLIQLSY